MTSTHFTTPSGDILKARGLTTAEISAAVREFRHLLSPMVGRAASNAFAGTPHMAGNDPAVQTPLDQASKVLDHIVGVTCTTEAAPVVASELPVSLKLAIAGAVARHTVDTIPLPNIQIALATALLSTLGAANSQWVNPSSNKAN